MRALQQISKNQPVVLSKLDKINLLKFKNSQDHNQNLFLIKVLYSPLNPSDFGFIAGVYGKRPYVKYPKSLGFEGSGFIEEAPDHLKNLEGKKVSFCCNYDDENYNGAWSDYTIVKKENIILFPDEIQSKIDMKQASCLYINPLTAFCFIDIMKKQNLRSAVHTAGFSAVGKTFTKLAKLNNLKIINILRNDANEEKLNNLGSFRTLSLNKFDASAFKSELSNVCSENDVKLAFECIGGNTTGTVLECLANNGKLYHYGNLSLRSITNLNTNDFIFRNKSIQGFWLFEYIRKNFDNDFDKFYNYFLEDYVRNFDEDIYNSNIQAIFKPEEFGEASKLYKNNMGQGKVLLDFSI